MKEIKRCGPTGISGYETARVIKADPALRNIPLISYTASVPVFEKKEISAGFDGNLYKPVSRKDLEAEKRVILASKDSSVKEMIIIRDIKFDHILPNIMMPGKKDGLEA